MTQLWLWIGFIGMCVGSVIFAAKSAASRRKEGMEFHLVSFFITLFAATLYLSMALGETRTMINGEDIFWGRYIDWLVTTPLLLLELGQVAGLRPKLLAGVMGADVFMILTGMIADFEAPPVAYLWYVISCGAFLAILWSLLTEFTASARRRNGHINRLFIKLRNILMGLWIGYPIVWILGAEGINVINIGVETVLYTVLDVSAKVGFGLVLSSAAESVLSQASRGVEETSHSYMDSDGNYDR